MSLMKGIKEGDRVRIKTRAVTAEDRKSNRYFEHMAGQVGTVQNVYGVDEIAVRVEDEAMKQVERDVQAEATRRLREKFLASVGAEQRSKLTKEELAFNTHYMMLVRSEDLEKP